MRYLWIEDFDGGKTGKAELKKGLEEYFQLAGKNINLCTLEETLEFLDVPSNWRLFDAVLIDIRFKICEKEQDEEQIYIKYFSSFLTQNKYEEYTRKLGGDANTASAGVLLYLALIHRYQYPQERIAFISANVDDTSSDLAIINDMWEFVTEAKYKELDATDKEDFSCLVEDAFELYKEILDIDDEEADERFPIPKTDSINWNDAKLLEEAIVRLENELKFVKRQKKEQQENLSEAKWKELKYNSVKAEFEKVGLKVPIAFEKPGGEHRAEISWKFMAWVEDTLNIDYYKLRANIIPICLEVADFSNDRLYEPCRRIANKKEIKELFSHIMELLPHNMWLESDQTLYTKIFKECVSLCEKLPKPMQDSEEDRYIYACKSVLKIARNWTSHQGIKEISAYDVVFIFHILLKAFLNMRVSPQIVEYDRMLLQEFCKDYNIISYEEVKTLIDETKACHIKEHQVAYQEFEQKATLLDLKRAKGYKFDEAASFYDTISAIGHAYSPIRASVSMKHLYALFLDGLEETHFTKDAIFGYSVVNRL